MESVLRQGILRDPLEALEALVGKSTPVRNSFGTLLKLWNTTCCVDRDCPTCGRGFYGVHSVVAIGEESERSSPACQNPLRTP